jgi:hypothetical protein
VVDNGNDRHGDALGHGKEDVATSLDSGGGSVCGSAGTFAEARKEVEGEFKGGGDARRVHSTAQGELCDQGGATHAVVEVGVAKGRPGAELHNGGVEGQHGQAETEAGLDLSALELILSSEHTQQGKAQPAAPPPAAQPATDSAAESADEVELARDADVPADAGADEKAHADSCAARASHLMDEVLVLPLEDQEQWLVLHGSLQQRWYTFHAAAP